MRLGFGIVSIIFLAACGGATNGGTAGAGGSTIGGPMTNTTSTSGTSGGSAADAAMPLADSEWTLTSLRGKPTVASTQVTIRFDDKGAGGFNGCNWYGGGYKKNGEKIEFLDFSMTMRGCLQPGVSEQERAFHSALAGTGAYEIRGDVLRLKSASGDTLLEFKRRVPLAMNPSDLRGTRWRLESIDGRPPALPITLAFDAKEDRITGFGGCRDYTSTYVANGDRINVTSTTMASTECSKGDAVIMAEGDYTTHLSESTHYKLEGDRLQLETVSGRKLMFARRR